jgi:hypothetical protein
MDKIIIKFDKTDFEIEWIDANGVKFHSEKGGLEGNYVCGVIDILPEILGEFIRGKMGSGEGVSIQ